MRVEPIYRVPEVVHLREADARECRRGGFTPEEALDFSIRNSTVAVQFVHNGEPLLYWGYHAETVMSDSCVAWMLTTPLADKFPLVLGLAAKRELARLHERYSRVYVLVDPDHLVAMRWLSWLGFTLHSTYIDAAEIFNIMRSERAR
jgi:hypothetical protein